MALFPERTGPHSPHRPTARPRRAVRDSLRVAVAAAGGETGDAGRYPRSVRGGPGGRAEGRDGDPLVSVHRSGLLGVPFIRRPGQTAFSLAGGVRRSVLGDRWPVAAPGRCDGR